MQLSILRERTICPQMALVLRLTKPTLVFLGVILLDFGELLHVHVLLGAQSIRGPCLILWRVSAHTLLSELCPENAGYLGFSSSQICILNSRRLLGLVWVPRLILTADWTLSRQQLEQP